MARPKTVTKVKEPIHIRLKKLANGNQSIYLDIYANGVRKYEFLKLYLIPEVDEASKALNANTLQAVVKIKADRIKDMANKKADIQNDYGKGKIKLLDFIDIYDKDMHERGVVHLAANKNTLKEICTRYRGSNVMMQDINEEYVLGFINFVRTFIPSKYGKPMKQITQVGYCTLLAGILKHAVKKKIIPSNPFSLIDRDDKIKTPESTRCYLTIDEVKQLIATPCKKPICKQAFLFACFCGLRISDICALTWGQVTKDGDTLRIEITMKKTKSTLVMKLSKQAIKWMPERGDAKDSDRVFADLPNRNYVNVILKPWAKKAGITKNISVHVGRHTFATMQLTLGTDLYTTSKLLGHKKVSTTQIYAKIVDKKKDEAIDRLDNVEW